MASGRPTGAPRATGPDEARRTNAGPRGPPERYAAGHNQGTQTAAKQQRAAGAANPGSAHNPQSTTAQEQVPGKTQPTHRTPQPGVAGTSGAHIKADTHTKPGVAGRSGNQSPSTHTHTAQPSQEWRGTSGARTKTHTHPNTPARSGGAHLKLEPKQTHPPRTPQPGVAGYKRNAHTNTHTPQHPGQEWRGTDETRVQAHTPTPHTPARSSRVQARMRTKSTQTPDHPSQEWRGAAQAGAQAHTHTPHTAASRWRGTSRTRSQRHTHPSQEWRGAAETRAEAHTPDPHTPARSAGVQAERAHKNTQAAQHPSQEWRGAAQIPSPSTHAHTAHPSQEWLGKGGARTQTHTDPNTPARSGGAQPKPEPKHTHPHRTSQPGVAGYKQSAHTNTHTTQHPSQEWRAGADTRVQAHTPTRHTPA